MNKRKKLELLAAISEAATAMRMAMQVADEAEWGDEFDTAENLLDYLIDFSNQVEQI